MLNETKITLCSICIVLCNLIIAPSYYAEESNEAEIQNSEKKIEDLQEQLKEKERRLQNLEPTEPKKIVTLPWTNQSFPSNVVLISKVIENGTKIPFKLIVDQPEYMRPIYEEEWHSSIGRWSYIPNRIYFAQHRLFLNYDAGLSSWYDFEHNIGLSIPMFQNENDLDLYIVAFQTEITSVYTLGNQIVVVGHPKRNGVQVITIKTGVLFPKNKEQNLLVQLVTQTGDEMDFSLINYMPPDFWLKQKEKLNERKEH
ncbi:MAG TPA: hypothetical protein VNU45_13700 [Rummeliibacillus sp.]|nr:hypothetical protein [Rummeliibacillus sp.]